MQPLLVDDPPSVGPYRLVARLGAGGMGQVFLATDDGRQLVALKLVHPGLAHDGEFRGRFRREIAAGRRVSGPFVATVLAADPDAATPWLATEYVPGPSLDDAVATVGPLGVEPAHVLAHGLITALAGIHATGLVHRDVKPSNVILGPDRPRLIDFGIARAADATALTSTGAMLGTPAYMSPEQAEGLPAGSASDVFSFGAVLVYATSGHPPFGEGAPHALLVRICDHEPDLDAVPEPFRGPVAACLAKDPGNRPTAAEVRELIGDPAGEAGPGWLPSPVADLATAAAPAGWLPTGSSITAPTAPPVNGRPSVDPGDPPPPAFGDPVPAAPARRGIRRRTLLAGAGFAGLAAAVGLGTSALVGTPEVTVPQAPAATGPRLLWSTPLGANTGQYPTMAVALGDELVHAVADNVLHALDIGTGASRWSHTSADLPGLLGYRRSYVTVAGDTVVVGTNVTVTALDAETGAVRWESRLDVDTENPDIAARVAVGEGLVHYAYRDSLVALDAASGARRWTHSLGDTGNVPSPVVANGRVFVHAASFDAVDAATGALAWQRPTEDEYQVGTGLAVVDGSVYSWVCSGPAASLSAVDAAAGAPRWRVQLGVSASRGGRPAVMGGLVVVTVGEQDLHLRALDAATGVSRWEGSAADGRVLEAGPVADGDGLCCGGTRGQLYVFDADTGARRSEYPGGSSLVTTDGLAFRAGVAYLGGGGGAGQVDAVAMS